MGNAQQLVKTEGFAFDVASHSYYMDGRPMTGCTTILGVLAKPALIGWAANMAVDYIEKGAIVKGKLSSDYPDEELYLVQPYILEEARTAHAKKRDEGATKGTDTHALVEEYVKYCIEFRNGLATGETEVMERKYDAISGFIHWATRNNIRLIASEAQFYSKSLFVAGTADLIFEKDGKRYVGDIKTYKKIWDRVPFFQCAGYALMAEEMGDPKIDGYCIINLPKERTLDESHDVMWSFDTEGDTKAFLACVTLYRQLANFK